MKIYLFCIKKRFAGSKWMLVCNTIVSSLALALLCIVITVPQILHHSEYTITNSLARDISKYGVVRNGGDTIDDENIADYIADIYQAPEIAGVGTWDYGGFSYLSTVNSEMDYWDEMQKIHENHLREFDENADSIPFVYMPGQAFPINNLKLYHGNTDRISDNDGWLIYLGYNFREVPIGTVFADEKRGITYTVEGIFQKDTTIVDAHALLWNLEGMEYTCSVTMDNIMLVIPPNSENYLSQNYFFMCSDEYTYEEASQKIYQISEKYGISTETGKLSDRVNAVLSDTDWLLNAIAHISFLLLVSAFIMLLTVQLLVVFRRKDELGVWLISGISRIKIFKILLAENMLKMLISSFVAFGLLALFVKNLHLYDSMEFELRYILLGNVPVLLLLCGMLIALLCSVFSIIYIKQKSIQEIVRGIWEWKGFLFFLSFMLSFMIMYYGLDLNRQFIQVNVLKDKALYEYGYAVMGICPSDITSLEDIPESMTSNGNIFIRCEGPIGNGIINTNAIDILWTQKEELSEPVKYEKYYLDNDNISMPKCIVGDAWKDEIYVVDGIKYIKLYHIESCVIGEFIPYHFEGMDKRCFVLGNSLSREQIDKLVYASSDIAIAYESNLSDETAHFQEWLKTFLKEGNIHEAGMDVWAFLDGNTFEMFLSVYRKIYFVMLLFCFVNCAFLAYFWGETHIYEYMLKRTLGYGKYKLFGDVISQFALFEILSLVTVLVVTCAYELIDGNIITWIDNIRLGFMQMVEIFVVFGTVLSLFPMRVVMKLKPVDILKNTE